jgi:hypothetical protein
MPRKKNDGRGRLGGREKGTPNKEHPFKQLLHEHSVEYFTPNINAEDVDIPDVAAKAEFLRKHQGKVFSQYQLDFMNMKPVDRAKLEVDLLAYHTPKMQAISADMNVKANQTLTDRLLRVAAGKDIPADE